MQNNPTVHEPRLNFEALTFADLVASPMEIRAAHISNGGGESLRHASTHLRDGGMFVPGGFENRLAWAIAHNLDGGNSPNPAPPAPPSRGIRSYRDKWSLGTRFTHLWDTLTKPVHMSNPDSGSTATLMSELGSSVLCEQNEGWQDPPSRPISFANAQEAFERVYAKNKAKVVGDIRRAFGERADNPEAIADEAWARVFCDYWSVGARRRFLGLCRISTLVCQVAHYVAIDIIRNRAALIMEEGPSDDADGKARSFSLENIGVFVDPSERIAERQLEQKIRECIERLPPKQRIVVEIVWCREVPAKEAAERLRVSEAAISQHLKKARETLRTYLQRHGFEVPA
ncbi:MAG: sigma-70 family RNA polymerase sigma factor [Nitrospira sp.]|nr:sigma-70 family RNA polymerase sigma factor [Nitrospira sp.]